MLLQPLPCTGGVYRAVTVMVRAISRLEGRVGCAHSAEAPDVWQECCESAASRSAAVKDPLLPLLCPLLCPAVGFVGSPGTPLPALRTLRPAPQIVSALPGCCIAVSLSAAALPDGTGGELQVKLPLSCGDDANPGENGCKSWRPMCGALLLSLLLLSGMMSSSQHQAYADAL